VVGDRITKLEAPEFVPKSEPTELSASIEAPEPPIEMPEAVIFEPTIETELERQRQQALEAEARGEIHIMRAPNLPPRRWPKPGF
jgi:hypothetical protein